MSLNRPKAAALIIGDEILSGKTLDTNTQTLARHLNSLGITLHQTRTIQDDIGIISNTLKQLSTSHNIVFTSGGIGPTHDDVTYESVAQAFGREISRHEETIQRMKEVQPEMEINAARMRMALLPSECDVFWTDGLWVPLVRVQNVYVLPGVPFLFQRMLGSIPPEELGGVAPLARSVVLCNLPEGDLAHILTDALNSSPGIKIGSYPNTKRDNRYRTMITIEGDDAGVVSQTAEGLKVSLQGWYQPDEKSV